MKSFMTTFSATNARRLRFSLAVMAALAVALMAGIGVMRMPSFSTAFQLATPANGADLYAPLDQHERHVTTIGSAIASPISYANRDLWYADTAPVVALDQHERHAPTIDQKARETGFYYTAQNVVPAPGGNAMSIDQKARETGFYYTALNAVAAPGGDAMSIDQKARETGFYYTALNVGRK